MRKIEAIDLLELPLEDIVKISRKYGKLKKIAEELNISYDKIRYIVYNNFYTRDVILKEKYKNIALSIYKGMYYHNIDRILNQ
ncbi:hypothetical protein GQX59_08630 [Brachyspira hyodysenteriae]|uniref:hypothetical protein n=1 Tax=Brachyspira hyodysenteriae TaxID=159 RepID=UPI001ADDDD06|nr:hypothetical protein [Brachyspira hyodysenteriae]QTM11491.1 hypothetical protein GQX59_08630 [Brachyspira hyodysenteriae]